MVPLSVIMPVYNASPFVKQAVHSILAQTYDNFEFIIIDNGSTDDSRHILQSFHDPRIRFEILVANIGPPKALNVGLQLARGQYIARMDADDLALPDRFAVQLRYLDAHPQCAALGTERYHIDEHGCRVFTPPMPIHPADLRWKLMFTSPLGHSTVMMRRDLIRAVGGYDERLRHAADYQLWSTMMSRGYQIANLETTHMLIRKHAASDECGVEATLMLRELALVSYRTIRELLGHPVAASDVTDMIRVLHGFQAPNINQQVVLALVETLAEKCACRAAPLYGYSLFSMALKARCLSVPQRVQLALRALPLLMPSAHNRIGRMLFAEVLRACVPKTRHCL